MKKQIISVVTVASLALVLGVFAFADTKISSITGGVEAAGETGASSDIFTTTETIRDDSGKPIHVEDVEDPIIKITTVSQASDANRLLGADTPEHTITQTSLTFGHNETLIREYEKTKDAQTSLEALDTIGATAAVERATGTSAEKVNQYAEIQILDISFNHAAKMEAQQSGGITLTMRVAGIGAESSGFVIYYDANGNPQVVPFSIVDVDGNGNARITFRLPNPSIIRIFSTVEV